MKPGRGARNKTNRMLRSTNRELGKSALIVVVAAGFGMMLHQVLHRSGRDREEVDSRFGFEPIPKSPVVQSAVEVGGSVEPDAIIQSSDKSRLMTWYNLNPAQFREYFPTLPLSDKIRLADILGSQIIGQDPKFVIDQILTLPIADKANIIRTAYERWLDQDPEAAATAINSANFSEDEILRIVKNAAISDPKVLSKLVERHKSLRADLDIQKALINQCVQAVRVGGEAILTDQPALAGPLQTAQLIVHPERLGTLLSEQSDLQSTFDLDYIMTNSLQSDPTGFGPLVKALPSLDLQRQAVGVAIREYAGYPDELYRMFESINDSPVGAESAPMFISAMEVLAPDLANRLRGSIQAR